MNIHFTDKDFFRTLQENSLVKIEVGSKLYGFDNADSDVDYLYIYIRPDRYDTSFVWEFQPLQYKEEGVDHIFVDLDTFVKHIMTGESTMFFEVLHELEDTPLCSLYQRKEYFYSYNVIKSYLGLAKRDLNKVLKSVTNEYTNYKKLHHGARGYWSALMVSKGDYSNQWEENSPDTFRLLKNFKNGTINADSKELVEHYQQLINVLRVNSSRDMEKGKIRRIMDPKEMAKVDCSIRNIVSYYRTNFYLDMSYFYQALENGIKY